MEVAKGGTYILQQISSKTTVTKAMLRQFNVNDPTLIINVKNHIM